MYMLRKKCEQNRKTRKQQTKKDQQQQKKWQNVDRTDDTSLQKVESHLAHIQSRNQHSLLFSRHHIAHTRTHLVNKVLKKSRASRSTNPSTHTDETTKGKRRLIQHSEKPPVEALRKLVFFFTARYFLCLTHAVCLSHHALSNVDHIVVSSPTDARTQTKKVQK